MSTYNACFYEEISKIIPELSANTIRICSSVTRLHNLEDRFSNDLRQLTN